jgi:hypothetical protein
MSVPIQGPKPRPVSAPPQTAPAGPVETTQKTEAAPATPSQAKGPGGAAPETSFTQAKPETKRGADLGVPSSLSRSSRGTEAAALDLQAAPVAANKAEYPIKPQAEATHQALRADPRMASPAAKAELGKFVDTDVFRKLDAQGQIHALELYKANLGPPPHTDRVRDAVDSLRSLKSEVGANDMLQGLRSGSPLSQAAVDQTKALTGSRKFADLSASDQRLVAQTFRNSNADPALTETMKKGLEDPKFNALSAGQKTARLQEMSQAASNPAFAGLNAELRQAVIESAMAGKGTAVELMNAATFTPGVGVQLTGTPQNQADFTNMLRRSMVRSPSFRTQMTTQNGNGAHPIRMDLGGGETGAFVDASGMFFTPPAPGRHTVDMSDIARFPPRAGQPPQPNATTQDQNVIHFMAEAINEAQGNSFAVSHRRGTDAENQYRRDMGQAGELVDVRDRPGHPGQVLFEYRNGHGNEVVHLDANNQITQIDY